MPKDLVDTYDPYSRVLWQVMQECLHTRPEHRIDVLQLNEISLEMVKKSVSEYPDPVLYTKEGQQRYDEDDDFREAWNAKYSWFHINEHNVKKWKQLHAEHYKMKFGQHFIPRYVRKARREDQRIAELQKSKTIQAPKGRKVYDTEALLAAAQSPIEQARLELLEETPPTERTPLSFEMGDDSDNLNQPASPGDLLPKSKDMPAERSKQPIFLPKKPSARRSDPLKKHSVRVVRDARGIASLNIRRRDQSRDFASRLNAFKLSTQVIAQSRNRAGRMSRASEWMKRANNAYDEVNPMCKPIGSAGTTAIYSHQGALPQPLRRKPSTVRTHDTSSFSPSLLFASPIRGLTSNNAFLEVPSQGGPSIDTDGSHSPLTNNILRALKRARELRSKSPRGPAFNAAQEEVGFLKRALGEALELEEEGRKKRRIRGDGDS